MEELLELILEEIKIERRFYAQNGNLFDVEDRVLRALAIMLGKVQVRLELKGESL